jgi:hypothetical protein
MARQQIHRTTRHSPHAIGGARKERSGEHSVAAGLNTLSEIDSQSGRASPDHNVLFHGFKTDERIM